MRVAPGDDKVPAPFCGFVCVLPFFLDGAGVRDGVNGGERFLRRVSGRRRQSDGDGRFRYEVFHCTKRYFVVGNAGKCGVCRC